MCLRNRTHLIFLFYAVLTLLFALIYLGVWNGNTYEFRVDPEYKLNVFDVDNLDYMPALTDIMQKVRTRKELREEIEQEYLSKLDESELKLAQAEENKKNSWQTCHPQPGFQDGECLYHNNGLDTQVRLVKEEMAQLNYVYQPLLGSLEVNLTEILDEKNKERESGLGFGDFLLYSIHTSIGNSDPTIIANSSKTTWMNTIQFIVSLGLVSFLLTDLKRILQRKR